MIVEKITGFESKAPVIAICDSEGKPFYYLENDEMKRITFNLPRGEYNVYCSVYELERPLTYVTPKLPIAEKHISVPPEIEIRVEENPNKASISTYKGFILIDPSMCDGGRPQEVFVKCHELGHYKYKTEWKCDVWSAAQMLKRGFNPSQCFYSSNCCLSEFNEERKNKLFTFLSKTICHE